ncbi:MAG: hypothetical protein R6W96_02220 [Clostridia bacterium]
MISCLEFVPAYSEAFKYIHENKGQEEVVKLWEYLSDHYLKDSLEKAVREKGLAGCYEYWGKSLREEGADFTMTLDKDKEEFTIEMHRCPSKAMLLDLVFMEPYEDYCLHCDTLYRLVLEPLGYEYNMDFTGCEQGKCLLRVRKSNI